MQTHVLHHESRIAKQELLATEKSYQFYKLAKTKCIYKLSENIVAITNFLLCFFLLSSLWFHIAFDTIYLPYRISSPKLNNICVFKIKCRCRQQIPLNRNRLFMKNKNKTIYTEMHPKFSKRFY